MAKTEEKKEVVLLPECQGKYKVIGTTCPTLYSTIGFIDFRTMTVDQAEALIESGSSYLERIKKSGS